MERALVPVVAGRPPWRSVLSWDGSRVWVCVGVHDGYYVRARAWFRRELIATGGATAVRQRYAAWLRREAAWYGAHGLTPPATHSARRVSADGKRRDQQWALRRARYGATGYRSAASRARATSGGRPRATACPRGHAYPAGPRRDRHCAACQRASAA